MKSRPYRQTARADGVAATRAHILRTARASLAEPGGDLSLDAIAARAGVGRPTIYRHFGSRGALFSAVVEQLSAEYGIGDEIDAALRTRDARAAAERFVDLSTRLWAEEVDLIRGALGIARDPEIGAVLRRLEEARSRDAAQIAKKATGAMGPSDLARALMMMTSPACFLYVVDGLGLDVGSARRFLRKMTRALFEGDR